MDPTKSLENREKLMIKKKKLKTTGGRSKDLPTFEKSLDLKKVIIILLSILFLLIAVIIIIVLIVSDQTSSVRYFEALSCEEEEPSPMHINSCLNAKCEFDLSTCEEPCPFGYETGESGCEKSCECAVEGSYEGDIAYTEDTLFQMTQLYGYAVAKSDFAVFSGSATSNPLWNDRPQNGRHKIYFMLTSSVTTKAKKAITEAVKRFKEKTCIDFLYRKDESRYFRFTSGRGCMSMVGRYRRSGQQVSIGRGCEIPGVVQHELLHLLGFHHEHSRPDRDSYLKVMTENIVKERIGNFKKRLKSQVRDLESEYDLVSILHYPSNAFSKNKKPTILGRKDSSVIKAQRRAFTKEDLYEVNVLYNCLEELDATAKWTTWTRWSTCDETCGYGERARYRKCKQADKLVEGCKGSKFHKVACQAPKCPHLDGKWSQWGKFTTCSVKCGSGYQWRKRRCKPYGQCDGVSYQGKSCNTDLCEGAPQWSMWTAYSVCNKKCGGGIKVRRRQCYIKGKTPAITCKGDISGTEAQKTDCNTEDCGAPRLESDSIPWSSCSASCDGIKTRERFCPTADCPGGKIEEEKCNVDVCDVPEPSLYPMEIVNIPQLLCDPVDGTHWLFGDFNGDKRVDVFCTSPDDSSKLALTTTRGIATVDWQGTLDGCAGARKYVGDFNGDGRDDILCQSIERRRLVFKVSTSEGTFGDGKATYGRDDHTYCTEPNDILLVIDANGDKKSDIACVNEQKQIQLRLNFE